ncbi:MULTISPECIES: VCBS repeat-containing protein [Flavobacteriaceae]|uniref:VCBS repeat-containing protein n=1 Tax=Flavobacteriaceae TaxID=49546 RepID=UPI00149189DB|nr:MULTISPECIES: VCBS repeat-containing protein [Allomuricauda]MDC6367650.1 VCBS repeat-containing protein [Muricauda sp. AC10]
MVIVFACKNGDETLGKENEKLTQDNALLFAIKPHNETGIAFKNMLPDTRQLNGILYEYYYNGAGVAIADFNNDDLQDIYFVSCLKSNQLYLNKGKLKFDNVTKKSNVSGKGGFSTGVTVVDINSDGKQDIYVSKSGKYRDINKTRNELYVNQGNDEYGNPIFIEQAAQYGLDLPNFSTQAAFFDYDKDGDLDLFLLNHGLQIYESSMLQTLMEIKSPLQSSRLYKNENGFYIDVSEESGLINNAISFGLGVAIGDLNNDTWPDILVGNDFSEKDYLYLNQKNGTFKEVINEATNHISFYSMGNEIADLNNDGWMDFVSLDMMSEHNYDIKTSMSGMDIERFYNLTSKGLHHQYMYNTLQLNNGVEDVTNGVPIFSDAGQMNAMSSTDWSWGPLAFDMDNDGWKDLFISNGIKRDFRNNDFNKYKQAKYDEFFTQYGEKNVENQQRMRDLVASLINKMPVRDRPNYFYHNQKGNGFSKKNGIWIPDVPTSSNGAAYADLDNDGDQDIVVNNTDDYAMIYENLSNEKNNNNYLKVRLKGSNNNIMGIGARLVVENNGQMQVLENYSTRGFQSASGSILHFGLGEKKFVEQLAIIWPDSKFKVYRNIKAGQTIELDYENANEMYKVPEKPNGLFRDITKMSQLIFEHQENNFDDFSRELLLPHKMSQFGPALATGDIDRDGLEDIYIGGALGYEAKLFVQQNGGKFKQKNIAAFAKDKMYEDVDALFFDADGDGDIDLYVVSGGNENNNGSQQLNDRLYENNGNGNFVLVEALPKLGESGSRVKACDFDKDGDLDLFVGGRQKPGHYPEPVSSYILQNESGLGNIRFKNVTDAVAKELLGVGMVTDALWVDVDNDSWKDLVVVGEWMSPIVLKNNQGKFENITKKSGLSKETGWWFSIASADFDGDGDQDLVAGNLGLNYKYKATYDEPFQVYQKDFDNNGTLDIVLGYYDLGNLYPLRGRQCSSDQMPFIKKKFNNYDAFAQATLVDVYGSANLENAVHYKASNFASSYFENQGDGTFLVKELGSLSQRSSVNSINIDDFDADGHMDMILSGNLYVSEVETPRNDASVGVYLRGDGKGNFREVPATISNLYLKGDVKKTRIMNMANDNKALVAVKNNDFVQLYELR